MRKLPKLEVLNGLAVDREELYSSEEAAVEDGPPLGSNDNLYGDEESKDEQTIEERSSNKH